MNRRRTAGPLEVLIVEDEAILAMELQGLVEDAGHEVVGWATTFAEVGQLLRHIRPDVVLLDLQLADGPSGIEVARHIRKANHCAVVFITANPGWLPDDLVGAVGVVAKPYTARGLINSLQYLHEGLRRPPPALPRPDGFKLSPAYASAWPSRMG